MINDTKLMSVLLVLISITALIYFLAAYHDVEELKNMDSNIQERFGTQVELTLFLIVGFGYIGISVWILITKVNTFIPYLITIFGSAFLIGIYMVAITKGVPIVGVEREADILATVSKMLQASIISISIILICSVRPKCEIRKNIKKHEKCFLCDRLLVDGLTSVTLRMLDGNNYVFDSDTCMKNFQKLNSVYGDSLE
jgi:hypothetical protein